MYAVTAPNGVTYGLPLFVVAAGLTPVVGVVDVLNLGPDTLYLAGAYLARLVVGGTLLGLTAGAIAAGAAVAQAPSRSPRTWTPPCCSLSMTCGPRPCTGRTGRHCRARPPYTFRARRAACVHRTSHHYGGS
jgi:hypothetical protein